MEAIFTTERFVIRNLSVTDEIRFRAMQTDTEVMKYTGNPNVQSPDEAKADLQRVISYYTNPENDFWVWAVADKDTDILQGTCAVVKNEKGEWDLGYRILRVEWGRGIASEVLPALIRHCFDVMQMQELVAYVYVDNAASVRVIEKAGLILDKEFMNEESGLLDRRYFIRKA